MASDCGTPAWLAVQTKVGRESTVAGCLASKGYEQFLPVIADAPSGRKAATRERPMFPGYLFCRREARPGLILTTPGVIRILSFGGTAACVTDGEINAIRALVRTTRSKEVWFELPSGQPVVVVSGPLEGSTGIYLTRRGLDRFVVLVPLLGRSVAVEIDARDVMPVPGPHASPATREPFRPVAGSASPFLVTQ